MEEEQLTLDVVRFHKDACIILAEDKRTAERFFIIREGNVRLSNDIQAVVEEGDILGPGDLFGVVSTMSGHRPIETAVAMTDVVLAAVRKEQFGPLIQNRIPVAKNILLMFSKRMRQLNESLAALTLNAEAPPDIEHLFEVAEYYNKEYQYKHAGYAYYKYIKYCPNGKNVKEAKEKFDKIPSHIKADKFEKNPKETVRTYHKDEMIFVEGEPAEEIFVIMTGSVKIIRVSQNGEILLAILKPGDVFGEMALLEAKPRGASALAYEKSEVIVVNQANFDHLIKTQPQLISKLIALLAERIWTSYRQLANTRINDPLKRMYDMLLIQLETKRVNMDVNGPYTFEFGTKELLNMIGVPSGEGGEALNKMLRSNFVKLEQNKLTVQDVSGFYQYVSFYRKKLDDEKDRDDEDEKEAS